MVVALGTPGGSGRLVEATSKLEATITDLAAVLIEGQRRPPVLLGPAHFGWRRPIVPTPSLVVLAIGRPRVTCRPAQVRASRPPLRR